MLEEGEIDTTSLENYHPLKLNYTLYSDSQSPRYVSNRNAYTILAALFVIGKNIEATQLSMSN